MRTNRGRGRGRGRHARPSARAPPRPQSPPASWCLYVTQGFVFFFTAEKLRQNVMSIYKS
eukprot:COSAG05_NODE_628_length_8241_cov_5.614468_1_plen_59_part_10